MSAAVELLFSVTVRASLLIALAWGAARLLRGRSAAIRHLIWTSAAIGSLALLAVAPFAPTVHTTRLPVWQNCSVQISPVHIELPSCADGGGAAATAATSPAGSDRAVVSGARPDSGRAAPSSVAGAGTGSAAAARPAGGGPPEGAEATLSILPASPVEWNWSLSAVLIAVWAGGALLVLLAVLLERVWVRRLGGTAGADGERELAAEARELGRRLGLPARVDLQLSEEAVPPLSWGLWRPRIVLPENAVDWPEGHRRAVLLHELGHARRRDVFTQTLAALSCALFWFNPLVWVAAARMRDERERACDDLVLQSGVRATSYARCLVDLARRLSPSARSPIALVGMAAGPDLVERVDRLVSRAAPRRGPGRTTTFVSALAALALVGTLSPHVIARPDCQSRGQGGEAYRLLVSGPDPLPLGTREPAGFAAGAAPELPARTRADATGGGSGQDPSGAPVR